MCNTFDQLCVNNTRKYCPEKVNAYKLITNIYESLVCAQSSDYTFFYQSISKSKQSQFEYRTRSDPKSWSLKRDQKFIRSASEEHPRHVTGDGAMKCRSIPSDHFAPRCEFHGSWNQFQKKRNFDIWGPISWWVKQVGKKRKRIR